MARQNKQTLTRLELAIMQVVWQEEETTVESIRQSLRKAGRPLALPSIRTMLGILQDKGFVSRTRDGRAHVYRPRVSAEDARKSLLSDLIDRAFDGSASSLVATVVSGNMVSDKDMREIRRLIGKREGGSKR